MREGPPKNDPGARKPAARASVASFEEHVLPGRDARSTSLPMQPNHEADRPVRYVDLTQHPTGAGVTPEAENIMKHKKNWPQLSLRIGFVLATTLSVTTFGCGPDGNNSSDSTSSSSGAGGSGGSGGSSTVCLDPTTHADILTIKDAGFCVVAAFDADYDPNAFIGNITWGRQGGIVMAEDNKDGTIKTTRYFAGPTATSGKLPGNTLDVNISLPAGSFFGGFILDLPFFNWTLASYTNADALVTGKIILFSGTDILLAYPINGFYSATAVIGEGETLGRLLYSGLSPIYKNASNTNGLYVADACGAVGMMPRLIAETDTTCGDSMAIETFGTSSGPVASDTAGNVFTVMPTATGQEAHGYAAESVKRGGPMVMGDKLFTTPGFGGSLAAIAPDGTGTGVLVFQPSAPNTFEWQEAIAQRFTIEGGKVVPQGTNGPFMSSPMKNVQLNFTTDDRGRIWVAIKRMTDYAVLVVERKS